MASFRGLKLGSFAIGAFGFVQVFGLSVSIAKQVQESRGRRFRGHVFKQSDGFSGFAFIEKKLGQLLNRGFVVGIAFQNSTQHFFRLVMLVLQAIETGEPERRFRIRGIEADHFLEFLNGAIDRF